ncbi:cell adhesion molecule CEACAM6-like [Glossophaga mutica]
MPQNKAQCTVSLLTFWSLPTTAKISIASTYAAEGKDVVLHIHNKPPEVVGITWYKGKGVDLNNVIAFFILTSTFHLSAPGNNGRQILKDDGSLLLKNITIKDAGIYTVVVHFPDSKTEVGFGQLDVYEHLRVPILLASSYGVLENEDDVVLTCYTDGLSIQWLFNDMDLNFTDRMKLTMDGRRLTIDPVKREDDGGYKCKASNPIMWVERRVRKPTLGASNTTVTENKDTVVLTCYSNAPTIQWLFNGTKLQPTEQMKLSKDHRRLTIDPVKREDAGNYQCEASNPISSVAKHLRVPILLASSYGVLENEDDVVLTCYTNGLSIQWLVNDMDLNFTDRMKLTMDGRRLTIDPVKREDDGGYKCKASNPIMWVERRVRKPTLGASNTTVTENKDTVVLTCYSNAPTIQWLFNGTKLQPTEQMKLSMDHRRLTIDPVKREDAGNYQCEASNPISSVASVALKLVVKFE